jgi:hypothetical protein
VGIPTFDFDQQRSRDDFSRIFLWLPILELVRLAVNLYGLSGIGCV